MRPLPTEFFKDGDHLQQIKRDGDVALFKRTDPRRRISYEVAVISQNPEREAFGTLLEASESYPPTSAWGDRGWTCQTRERAEIRYAEVCARRNHPIDRPRRRSAIPLLIPGGNEIKHPVDVVVELQSLQKQAEADACVDCDSLAKHGVNDGPCPRHRTSEPDTGADPIGDGTFRMYPSGDIVSFEERNSRLARFNQGPRPLNCQEQAWTDQQTRQSINKP